MAVRERITNADVDDIHGLQPLADVQGLIGVRVHDVGQGDSVTILDLAGRPALQFDYGGRQDRPFASGSAAEERVPVDPGRVLMLSHWDEDHWCTARETQGAKAARWLVPRQITSPRAVAFASEVDRIRCIPDRYARTVFRFLAGNGDAIWWEKIAPAPQGPAKREDCNATGVGLAVVSGEGAGGEVILLPGDAPFDRISHYHQLFLAGYRLAGLVAFHHGAATHWNDDTRRLLREWAARSPEPHILFSCAKDNPYGHPHRDLYETLFPRARITTTFELRARGLRNMTIEFGTD